MSSTFLGTIAPKVPYVIGVAGSVAVGKSTFARILQALLARWPDHPKVDLVTTDGFLHPNAVLDERGLMNRKGFPESYDTRRLLQFLRELKSGAAEVARHRCTATSSTTSSTARRSIVQPARHRHPRGPQRAAGRSTEAATEFVSDYFDFSIYIDADEARHRGVVRPALPDAARDGVPGSRQLLPPLRRPHRRGGASTTAKASGATSTAEPAREHRARPARAGLADLHKGADHRVDRGLASASL